MTLDDLLIFGEYKGGIALGEGLEVAAIQNGDGGIMFAVADSDGKTLILSQDEALRLSTMIEAALVNYADGGPYPQLCWQDEGPMPRTAVAPHGWM